MNTPVQLLQKFFKEAQAGIAYTDTHGRIIDVNPEFCKMTGYQAFELRNRYFGEITHPADVNREIRLFSKFTNPEIPLSIEKRYMKKDGSYIHVRMSSVPLLNQAREAEFFLAFVFDISRQIRARQAVRKGLKNIRRTNKMTAQLNSLLQHELHDPVQLFQTAETSRWQKYKDPRIQEAVSLIEANAFRLRNMLKDLQQFSSIDAAVGTVNIEPVTSDQFLTAVSRQIRLAFPGAENTRFECEISVDFPEVFYSDAHRLNQVIMYLLYSLFSELETGKVRIYCYREEYEDELTFAISSTESEIHPGTVPNVLIPVRKKDTRQNRQSVRGLSSCKELARSIDGDLRVESNEGAGITCFLHIPVRKTGYSIA